jgi:hypothetical protein
MQPPRDERAPDAWQQEPEEPLPLLELETLLTRLPSRRKRLAQVALVLVVVALAAAALHGVLPSSSAPAGGSNLSTIPITVLSNVNFGTLMVNGKKPAGQPPLTAFLPTKGTTIITLAAPPFHPYTCRFTDLIAPMDDQLHCSIGYEHMSIPTPTANKTTYGRITMAVYLTPDDLPADQQSQALAAMSLPLSTPQQTTVHPGEYIATSYLWPRGITSWRAATSLLARATFEPSQLPGPPTGPGCGVGICPRGAPPSQATALHLHAWSLYYTEALRWQISDAAGAVLADVSIPSSDIVGVLLTEDAAAGWQIAQLNTILGTLRDTTCHAGMDVLQATLDSSAATVLHDAGVEGCELRGQVNGVDEGRYIWRFGVLLAADAQAHAYHPDLPIAPAAEITAVGE